jgi:RHS repeat-associated protein
VHELIFGHGGVRHIGWILSLTLVTLAVTPTGANAWDSQNRLRTCVTAQHTSAFTYSSDGLRRQTVLDGQATTQYILDSSMVIRENTTGGVNAGQVTYLCGPRGPEYRRAGSGENPQVSWYCYDGLGSVLAEVSPSGYITGARQMDVYGAPRATQGTPTSRHAYVGALGHPTEDETGLIYMRARWMDPVTGTFVSEDPAQDGANWYGYCGGDPVNATDTSGLFIDLLVSMIIDKADDSSEYAVARAAQAWGRERIEDAVIYHSAMILGALAATEMDITANLTADGFYIKNEFNGALIHIDLANHHGHSHGPHIDFQGSIKGRKGKVQLFVDGFMAGFGI